MLDSVKAALRLPVTLTAYDDELNEVIGAALGDLGLAGVQNLDDADYLIIRAVTTYVRLNFGNPGDYGDWDRLKKSYDEQKAQLSTSLGYNGGES